MQQSAQSVRLAQNANDLGTKPIGKLIARFAAPSIVAMLVMSLYNIVDQLFIGRYVGYLGNAATNIVFPVNVLTIAVSMLVGEGATAMYSIRLGEGKTELARKTVANAIVLLSCIGVGFAIICLLFLQPLLGFFGATPAIMPYAIDYAAPIVWGIPFVVVGPGLNALIRASGSPTTAMKAMATGAIMNTILDPLFIITFGMGVKGAAIATAIAQLASFCVTISFAIKGNRFGLRRHHFRLDWSVVRRILTCGLSPSASQLAIMVVIITVNQTLGHYGADSKYGAEIPLAAHGVTMKVNQIVFSFLFGISMGAQPIIGFNYGAGDYGRVKKTFILSTMLATGIGMAAFLVFFFSPQPIINLFGQESPLYNEFAQHCFRVFLFCIALNGFTLLSGTFFQSMAKVGRAAFIQLSRQVLFMVPAVHILSSLYGVEGVLLAGPITDSLSFVLAFLLVCLEFKRLTAESAARQNKQGTILPESAATMDISELRESTSASARLA